MTIISFCWDKVAANSAGPVFFPEGSIIIDLGSINISSNCSFTINLKSSPVIMTGFSKLNFLEDLKS